jgi:hypothetical protein
MMLITIGSYEKENWSYEYNIEKYLVMSYATLIVLRTYSKAI